MNAARYADAETLRVLLAHGARVDAVDAEGRDALQECIVDFHERALRREMIEVLIAAGAKLDADSATAPRLGETLETLGIIHLLPGWKPAVRSAPGADERDDQGRSRLLLACLERRLVDARTYLAVGDDARVCDKQGRTALHLLFEKPYRGADALAILELLLRRRELDVNAATKTGKTPLHELCDSEWRDEHARIAFALLLKRPDLDLAAVTKNGMTALHFAAKVGILENECEAEIIRTLLARGLSANAKTKSGKRPIDLVIDSRPDVLDIFEEHEKI
jgi:ankyrin repeat protein